MTTLPPIIHVVDDDVSFRTALGELLRACGYRVALYESAEQLLKMLPGGDRGCILLDVQMAGLSGPQLQDRLAELGCRLRAQAIEFASIAFRKGLARSNEGCVQMHDKAVGRAAHQRHQVGQAFDILAVNLDQLELPVASLAPRMRCIHRRMQRLDQRRFAHAARPHNNALLAGSPRANVPFLEQHVAHAVDAFE